MTIIIVDLIVVKQIFQRKANLWTAGSRRFVVGTVTELRTPRPRSTHDSYSVSMEIVHDHALIKKQEQGEKFNDSVLNLVARLMKLMRDSRNLG